MLESILMTPLLKKIVVIRQYTFTQEIDGYTHIHTYIHRPIHSDRGGRIGRADFSDNHQ